MEELYNCGCRLDLAVTLKDELGSSKSGRIYVDEFCGDKGIPVLKVRTVNDDHAVQSLREANIDWLFIIGWSQIAGIEVLKAPRLGAIGMHPTLLPQGRGRASIPWAILKDLRETGVTMFKLDGGVDSGPVLAQERVPIAVDETATTLYERISQAHRRLIARSWPSLAANRLNPVAQDQSKATVWPGRKPEDGAIQPEMSVEQADRLVRATTRPYPGAFWDHPARGRIRIWRGAPASGTDSQPGACRIFLADGFYDALDFDVEEPALTSR